MTERERMILLVTLCATLFVAVAGIVACKMMDKDTAKEVSIAVGVQWGAGLALYAKQVSK